MKNQNITLSDTDVKTLLFCLELFVSSDMADSEIQNEINVTCCVSAIEKLIKGSTDLLPNEFRVMYSALLYVQCLCNGSVDIEPNVKSQCVNYLFSVNKLVSVFGSAFPNP